MAYSIDTGIDLNSNGVGGEFLSFHLRGFNDISSTGGTAYRHPTSQANNNNQFTGNTILVTTERRVWTHISVTPLVPLEYFSLGYKNDNNSNTTWLCWRWPIRSYTVILDRDMPFITGSTAGRWQMYADNYSGNAISDSVAINFHFLGLEN